MIRRVDCAEAYRSQLAGFIAGGLPLAGHTVTDEGMTEELLWKGVSVTLEFR